jgi:hypothetical protein
MPDDMTPHDAFWLGRRHGRRIYEHAHYLADHEPAMRLEVQLIGAGLTPMTRRHRAFALGELRGYREARDQ